jgi:hypothetical protein
VRLYRVAPDVAWVDARAAGQESTEVFLARMPDGPPLVLQGSAWLVWSVVTEHADLDDVVAQIALHTSSTPATVAPDVEAFLERLVAQGLLDRDADPDTDREADPDTGPDVAR